MLKRLDTQYGFTLLELLLAVGLLALVAAIVYSSFRATVSAMERSTAAGGPAQQARVTLARMADELVSADWSAEREETLFVGASEEIDGRPSGHLQLTSRSHVWYPTQPPATERAVIDYSVTQTPQGLQLWRQEEANPFALGGSPERLEMAGGLSGVQFRFYSDGAWTEAWDASVNQKLPRAVEVVLTFADANGREEEFRTMVALPETGS